MRAKGIMVKRAPAAFTLYFSIVPQDLSSVFLICCLERRFLVRWACSPHSPVGFTPQSKHKQRRWSGNFPIARRCERECKWSCVMVGVSPMAARRHVHTVRHLSPGAFHRVPPPVTLSRIRGLRDGWMDNLDVRDSLGITWHFWQFEFECGNEVNTQVN